MKDQLKKNIQSLIVATIVLFGVSLVQAEWKGNTSHAPQNNVSGIIDVSGTSQSKAASSEFDKTLVIGKNTASLGVSPAIVADGGVVAYGPIKTQGRINTYTQSASDNVVGNFYSGSLATMTNIGINKSQFGVYSSNTADWATVEGGKALFDGALIGSPNRTGAYTLDLKGITNLVEKGDSCDLNDQADMDKGCPLNYTGEGQSYLEGTNVGGIFGVCRFVNPSPSGTPKSVGSCYTTVVVDLCPNLAGDQSSVPYGYTLNTTSGDCDRSIDVSVTSTLFGVSIANVTGVSGFTFDQTQPVGSGGRQEGYHNTFTGIVRMSPTGNASAINGNISISKNSITIRCVNVARNTAPPATVSAPSTTFILGDYIAFSANTGNCP